MLKKLKYLLRLWLLICFSYSVSSLANENIHELDKLIDKTSCISCHNTSPQRVVETTKYHLFDRTQFGKDGVEMCTSCHSEENSHMVGDEIDFPIPADLPVGENRIITCLTCHYTHGSLKSDRPQASVSFMDKLLNSERLHKSYLIRRNNTDGALCLTCHKATEE